jgi:hypothetical protein
MPNLVCLLNYPHVFQKYLFKIFSSKAANTYKNSNIYFRKTNINPNIKFLYFPPKDMERASRARCVRAPEISTQQKEEVWNVYENAVSFLHGAAHSAGSDHGVHGFRHRTESSRQPGHLWNVVGQPERP